MNASTFLLTQENEKEIDELAQALYGKVDGKRASAVRDTISAMHTMIVKRKVDRKFLRILNELLINSVEEGRE